MKTKQLFLSILLFFFSTVILFAQEAVNSNVEVVESGENELLYNTSWKLIKTVPEFDTSIAITLLFQKEGKQLKVTKEVTSMPKLEGTKLITTKKENINFYSWKYGVLETKYEGDDVVEQILDYSKLVLMAEGYAFKIKNISENNMVLEVLKAPNVIFGKSIFEVNELHFEK
ncbi:hypothetical protein [Pseudofulvibacter geojedonensis]|uniref:Lipocalin-like domain-containing protein n=1 Tax=Pseudofulvibacter geojedonensis TaxID=1123758 RepID=A0ABW3I275_9FLAO